MEQSRLGVFLILIIIILLVPDGNSPTQRHEIDHIIERERFELETLRNSTFGQPGNLTGINTENEPLFPSDLVRGQVRKMREDVMADHFRFRGDHTVAPAQSIENQVINDGIEKGPMAEMPKSDINAQELKNNRRDPILSGPLPLYRNVSGTLHGEWSRMKLPGLLVPQWNTTYQKNITADSGKVTFNIEEKVPGIVQEVGMNMMIKNQEGGDSREITLYGVHFTESGEMILTTSSERFSGIFALPHFTLTEKSYNVSKALLLSSIADAIQKQEDSTHSNSPWQSGSDQVSDPRCEYIVYIQFHPIDAPDTSAPFMSFFPFGPNPLQSQQPMTIDTIQKIEQELRHPTGAPVPAAPPIILSSIIYSPTCGFVLSTKGSEGLKIERYYNKASNFALCAATVMVVQIWLLIRQMNESNTPSTVSRVSLWTMAMMSVVDGYLTIAFLAVSIFVDSCFLPLVSAAFFSFLLVSLFGMRFMMTIYRVQRPERRANPPAAPATNATPAPPPVTLSASGLPVPVTAAPQAPVALPPAQDTNDSDDDGRQDLGMLYSRFYFILLGSIFLSLHATSWPPFFRNIFMNSAVILTNSFWVPQIYRNIMRGCRKAFTWEFVIGMSFCRILPMLYIYCWKDNIFYIEPNLRTAVLIIGWVWFQVCALVIQEMFGPRFLIPTNLLPPAYDYHPILPLDDLEAADPQLPTSPSTTPGARIFDCAICMQSVEVPTISSESEAAKSGGMGLLGRRGYMVTPCKHVFHSKCLEGWMRFRLQCPICRNPLPPL